MKTKTLTLITTTLVTGLVISTAHAQTPSIPRGGSGTVPYQMTVKRDNARYKWRIVYNNPRNGISNQVIASNAVPKGWNAANGGGGTVALVRVPETARPSGKHGWYRVDMHLGPAHGRPYGLGSFFVY